jgi:hypothetical protein
MPDVARDVARIGADLEVPTCDPHVTHMRPMRRMGQLFGPSVPQGSSPRGGYLAISRHISPVSSGDGGGLRPGRARTILAG